MQAEVEQIAAEDQRSAPNQKVADFFERAPEMEVRDVHPEKAVVRHQNGAGKEGGGAQEIAAEFVRNQRGEAEEAAADDLDKDQRRHDEGDNRGDICADAGELAHSPAVTHPNFHNVPPLQSAGG